MAEKKESKVEKGHNYLTREGYSDHLYEIHILDLSNTSIKFIYVDLGKDPVWHTYDNFANKYKIVEDLGIKKAKSYARRT